eukprot:TRINITY_DN2170_c4_g1_i1.p1 TRINITY_DN2170_c4_g1~~TRINITY_DN2170_c4_g1_i1.p1  ORF type:complete len:450 (+),score=81.85 TRINITY_DN2170_c4_g1_i1:36-1352(+)
MASALVLLNTKGKPLITRNYRQDVPYTVTEIFIQRVIEEEDCMVKPIFEVDGLTFAWLLHNNIYFVLVSKINCNASMLVVYLHHLLKVFQDYMETVTEESIRDNFVVIYELLDEMMDFGYPQYTDSKVLRDFITQESHKLLLSNSDVPKELPPAMTGATGTCPWRPEGIKHRKNQIFLDVIDSVNLLVNTNGDVLHSEIVGTVKVKCELSGMPRVKVSLNDKQMAKLRRPNANPSEVDKMIEIDDIKFHQCVMLNKFDDDRTIAFIPPDGDFELMTYRLPCRVKPIIDVSSQVERHGTRLEILVKVKSMFPKSSVASNVVIRIPVPPDADSPQFKASTGRNDVKYLPNENCVKWTLKILHGGKEVVCRCTFGLPSIRQQDMTVKKPISVDFQIPTLSLSGMEIKSVKVHSGKEKKENYQSLHWVRHITQAGQYEIRME